MSLETMSEMLVKADECRERAVGAQLPIALTILALTKIGAAAVFGRTPVETRAPLGFVANDPKVRAHAAATRAEVEPVRVPELPSIVEQYDDSHFTGEDTSAQCRCESHPVSRALYLHREGVKQLDGWQDIAAGLATYNRLPKWERREWLARGSVEAEAVARYFFTLETTRDIEGACEAASHYRTLELDVQLGMPVTTSSDEDRIAEERERWNTAEQRRLAWPLVSFQHHYREGTYEVRGDGERGYRADPTWIASEEHLAAEYGLPKSRVMSKGFDADGERTFELVRSIGRVHAEYKRRDWCEEHGRFFLPFLSPSSFKFHAEFLRAADRRRKLRKAQRRQIARLVVALGGDVRAPEVSEWVTRLGYTRALDALRARARREGVGLYA